MKLSDFVVDFFAKRGVHHSFFVSGGAVVHLVDSASKHPEMLCIPNQREENSASAADMYARITGNFGLAMSTSGPGATNMVTSICNAYVDSIPLICLTGQVARFRLKKAKELRQQGFQEIDVVSICQSITKYSVLIRDPKKIRYELEKALYIAKEGRPGPVVLDIPDDLQREEVDPEALESFTPPGASTSYGEDQVKELLELIKSSKKPMLICGAGINCAGAQELARAFIHRFQLPAALTWGGADLLEETNPYNMGRVGVCGPRAGNFALQSSDLIIALGTRLSQMVTGGKQNLFAPSAKKVMVDVDPFELNKFDKSAAFGIDLPIQADLKDFFQCALSLEKSWDQDLFKDWREKVLDWKHQFPLSISPAMKGKINPYFFFKELSKHVQENAIMIGDTGANLSWLCQSFEFKKGQRIFSAWNHTPMGYSLPASVGAAFATEDPIFCMIGDGGFMMCLQELATIRRFDLPVRIFIFDNQGHAIQKQTLDTWLNSNYVAVDVNSGLYFPDYHKIADAFHLPFYSLTCDKDVQEKLEAINKREPPYICNVEVIASQKIEPMLKFGAGLEDLTPQLAPEEIERVMSEGKYLYEKVES